MCFHHRGELVTLNLYKEWFTQQKSWQYHIKFFLKPNIYPSLGYLDLRWCGDMLIQPSTAAKHLTLHSNFCRHTVDTYTRAVSKHEGTAVPCLAFNSVLHSWRKHCLAFAEGIISLTSRLVIRPALPVDSCRYTEVLCYELEIRQTGEPSYEITWPLLFSFWPIGLTIETKSYMRYRAKGF